MELAVAVTIVVSIRRRPRAWRVWVALAIAVLANGLLVGQGRRSIALATLAAVVTVIYVVVSQVNADAIQNSWQGGEARAWEQRITAGLAAASTDGRRAVLADADTPWYIIGSAFAPLNELSDVVPRYTSSVHVDGPLTGPLVIADPTGAVLPAAVSAIKVLPLARGGCTRAYSSRSGGGWRLPATPPTLTGRLFLLLTPRSRGSTYVPMYVDTGTGYLPGPTRYISLAPGGAPSIAWLGDRPARRVAIGSPGATVCLQRLQLVSIRPR